jgi:hypothetical protein
MPMVWTLTQDEDEQQDLVVHLLEYTLPRYSFAQPWGVHVKVTLTSKLLTLRRTEQRYRKRFE